MRVAINTTENAKTQILTLSVILLTMLFMLNMSKSVHGKNDRLLWYDCGTGLPTFIHNHALQDSTIRGAPMHLDRGF
jgi:hypothetical protein